MRLSDDLVDCWGIQNNMNDGTKHITWQDKLFLLETSDLVNHAKEQNLQIQNDLKIWVLKRWKGIKLIRMKRYLRETGALTNKTIKDYTCSIFIYFGKSMLAKHSLKSGAHSVYLLFSFSGERYEIVITFHHNFQQVVCCIL